MARYHGKKRFYELHLPQTGNMGQNLGCTDKHGESYHLRSEVLTIYNQMRPRRMYITQRVEQLLRDLPRRR